MNKGYASILLLVLLLPMLAFFSWRYTVPLSDVVKVPICRPDYANADGTIKANAPEVMAPDYTHEKNNPNAFFPTLSQELKPYRLVKSTVAMATAHVQNFYSPSELREVVPYDLRNPDVIRSSDGASHHHFSQWKHPAIVGSTLRGNPSGAVKYGIQYPAAYSELPGYSSSFVTASGTQPGIFFADHKLIFLPHLKDDGSLVTFEGTDQHGKGALFSLVDVYQQVQAPGSNQPVTRLSQEVLNCTDNPSQLGEVNTTEDIGAAGDNKQIQIGAFIPRSLSVELDWYYPGCKPAIYLYPQEKTTVSVQVHPKGYLTYSDPQYPFGGWRVTAFPDGKILEGFREFEYLYYESKIRDSEIKKPENGYVVAFDELPQLYTKLLPKLGLNTTQTADFKEYWEKTLPKAPFYFVGVMPQVHVDEIEPLQITPNPDTIVRVRLFFEALDQKIEVPEPVLPEIKKSGFYVVEWGGMVKTDRDHPFTCSQ